MIIQYSKALFNKIIKCIDTLRGIERTKEEPVFLPESVATNFPKDDSRIFRIINKFLNKVAFEADGSNSYNTSFKSKHNGIITIRIINYKTQGPEDKVEMRTQIKISNDRGKTIEYL